MITNEKYEIDTSLRQAAIEFMQFVDRKFNEQLPHSQLEDFMARVKILETDKNLEKTISLLLKTNLSGKINIEGFGLPKDFHVPAVFLIVKKMLPQSEIQASLEFDDIEKDINRIGYSCGRLFDIGDRIDLTQ